MIPRIGPAARRRRPLASATIRKPWPTRLLLVGLAVAVQGPANAREPPPIPDQDAAPRAACLAAARRAEATYELPAGLLVAIALSESGLHAHALSIGGRSHFPDRLETARHLLAAAPARSAVMAGCLQVNARAHARGSDWPLDAMRSADWAAALLRRQYAATGDWTAALRRWHGGSPAGSQRVVCRVWAKLEAVTPDSRALSGAGCAGAMVARNRRTGAVLLEVAEAGNR